MKTKLLKTTLLIIGLVCCALVPLSSMDGYNSLSEYANDNSYYLYSATFISISFFFLVNALTSKRWFDYILAAGMASILIFDVYNYRDIHNIVTVITLLSALFSIVWFSQRENLYISIFFVSAVIIIFLLGFLSDDVYFAFAEIITIYLIGLHRLKKLWLN